MSRFLHFLGAATAAFGFTLATAADAPAAQPPWPLPVLSGDMTGVFTSPGVPDVRWHLTATAARGGRERLVVEAEADGLKLAGEIELDPLSRDGVWRLTTATVDAALWLPVVAENFSLAWLKEISVNAGTIHLTGAGTLRTGVPDGALTVTLRDATLAHAGSGTTLQGVTADLRLDGLSPLHAPAEQVVTFRTAQAGGIALANGLITFSLPDESELRLTRAEVGALGGHVKAEPFVFAFATPNAETVVQLDFAGLDLAQVRPLLPPGGVAETSGRVSGRVALGWTADGRLSVGEARLSVAQGQLAPVFRLQAAPGLLSSNMPAKLMLLPTWLGPLARGAEVANPVYDALHEIELGRVPLRVESLSLSVRPQDDPTGHTATLRISARPVGESVVSTVNFDLIVNGPLEELLRHLFNRRLSPHGK
ncbi:MAG: YdbH domain-containing protein [Verrucomicrobiota bacterium]